MQVPEETMQLKRAYLLENFEYFEELQRDDDRQRLREMAYVVGNSHGFNTIQDFASGDTDVLDPALAIPLMEKYRVKEALMRRAVLSWLRNEEVRRMAWYLMTGTYSTHCLELCERINFAAMRECVTDEKNLVLYAYSTEAEDLRLELEVTNYDDNYDKVTALREVRGDALEIATQLRCIPMHYCRVVTVRDNSSEQNLSYKFPFCCLRLEYD